MPFSLFSLTDWSDLNFISGSVSSVQILQKNCRYFLYWVYYLSTGSLPYKNYHQVDKVDKKTWFVVSLSNLLFLQFAFFVVGGGILIIVVYIPCVYYKCLWLLDSWKKSKLWLLLPALSSDFLRFIHWKKKNGDNKTSHDIMMVVMMTILLTIMNGWMIVPSNIITFNHVHNNSNQFLFRRAEMVI